ncbi:MAG TPA: hypothetical protein VI653_14470 [Steroidobacteraceae bacterium]
MIQMRFNSLAGTDPAILGPAPFFRIEGSTLQQGPDRSVVGRYFDHHWEIGDRFVSSYECVDSVLLHFEGPGGALSRIYGPFQQLRFPNGSCYADKSLFAELVDHHKSAGGAPDARSQWLHRADLTRWPVLVVSAAAPDVTLR